MEDKSLVTTGNVDEIISFTSRKTLARVSQSARKVARQHS
jgi:hypothetical protein